MKQQHQAYIYALSAIVLWSTIGTAFKIALRYTEPLQLIFFASGIGIIIFGIISFLKGNIRDLLKTNRSELKQSLLGGFLNPFLYYAVLLQAYDLTDAQLAQPLNYLWPVMLVLFSAPLLGEKIKPLGFVSVIVGFVGVFIIASKGEFQNFNPNDVLGASLAAGSSIIWALGWIFSKKDRREESKKLFWNFLFGFIYLGIAVSLFSDFSIPEFNGILAVGYVGFFEVGFTFYLWMRALQLTESSDKISHFVFLSPFLALIFIHFILGEELYYTTYIGVVFIGAGILLGQLAGKKRRKV
jgi:drug/metabolite transporter (DMT)-like permease